MKKLFITFCICTLVLTGCSTKEETTKKQSEKTIVLEDNVIVNQIDYSNKISKESIKLGLKTDEIFNPLYFDEDKIYGEIYNNSDPNTPSISGYYSKTEGLVKLDYNLTDDISSIFLPHTIDRMYNYSYNMLTNLSTTLIQDRLTGEKKEFATGINNTAKTMKIDFSEDIYKYTRLGMVKNTKNYYYYGIGMQTTPKDSSKDKQSKENKEYTSKSYSELALYDFNKNSTITYGGKLSPNKFPLITKVIYNNKDKCLYGLSSNTPEDNFASFNKLYRINIKDGKYTLKLIYTFDFGDKLLESQDATIIDGNLIFTTYVLTSLNYNTVSQDEGQVIVFNLKDNAIVQTVGTDTSSTFFRPSENDNLNKYFFVSTNFEKIDNQLYPTCDVFLSRLNDNNIEYIYKFDKPMNIILSQDNKQMFSSYYNEETKTSEYYLYNINID